MEGLLALQARPPNGRSASQSTPFNLSIALRSPYLILNGKVVFIMCNPFCLCEKDCPNCDVDCEYFDYHSAILDEQLSNFYDDVL